jgi:hypothetical protein
VVKLRSTLKTTSGDRVISHEADRLSKLLLNDYHLCSLIDERIGEDLVSRAELAAEDRYDSMRERSL